MNWKWWYSMYPKSLEKLIESFKMLPGVGHKTAERYALSLLESPKDDVEEFSRALLELKQSIRYCSKCFNLSDGDVCDICTDSKRDFEVICVVSNAKEVFSIEKSGTYNGVYHVLGGLISTQKGILPDQLNIDSLENRSKDAKEVILALNASVEGELTSLYLGKRLSANTNVTRLAFGLPIGGQLDYADDMTLMKAFEGRNKL